MGKLVTYFSVGLSAFALVYAFDRNVYYATAACLLCVMLLACGFGLESYMKANGNAILNRLIYYLTKDDKKYNILHKHITYTYEGNNKYRFEKKYEILPIMSTLDRASDRFGWSAPSAGCDVNPTNNLHAIKSMWQQEMWTCYTVSFNEICKKRKSYKFGSVVSNLIDTTNTVVPFLSNTIDRKTKCTTLEVIFPRNNHPQSAKFSVFSAKAGMEANFEENLPYDAGIGGFKKTITFPRKGWRYVISWK